MFCKNCGQELADGTIFCAACGTKVEEEVATTQANEVVDIAPAQTEPAAQVEEKENKFITIANKLGKFGLIFCWTIIAPLLLSTTGLALSIVGMCLKNKFPKYADQGKSALIKNIIGVVIAYTAVFIIYLIIGFISGFTGTV